MFYDKLNYKEDGFYSVVDQVELTNGEYKGVLNHDHVDRGTILIIDEEGDEIKDYFISDNPEKPWETEIELFGSKGVKTAYIHYNTKGDIVDADDINKIQDAIGEDDGALDKVKEDIIVLKETKSDKRYVDRELDKKLDNDSFLDTMKEITEYTRDDLIPELKKYADDLFADVPDVFHDLNQNVVTEDMKPGDFKHGVTICSQSSIDSFPSIREYGVSITIRGVHASYAQLFITRYGDIWARRSGVIGEWNGDWYNSKKEIDKKADKDYVDKQIEGAGKVKSVNGQTGDIVLDAMNIEYERDMPGFTIHDMLALMADDFVTELDKKADKNYADAELKKKADKSELDKKADKSDLQDLDLAGRTSTIVIANYDSHEKSKKGADIVINKGENAAEKINDAIQSLKGTGGEVKLMEGNYNLEYGIAVNVDGVHLTGVPNATILVQNQNWKDNPYMAYYNQKHIIDTRGLEGGTAYISNLILHGNNIEDSAGFNCSDSSQILNCVSNNSGRDGFDCYQSSQITSCTSNNSGRDGFSCRDSSQITSCTSNNNGENGFRCSYGFKGICSFNILKGDKMKDGSSAPAVVEYNVTQEG